MPFYNLIGSRELNTHKSTAYKQQVIRYLQACNYILTTDSDYHGTSSDAIFKRPYVDGEKTTHAEVKDTKLSLSDTDFLGELARYFHQYVVTSQGFYMLLFVRECANKARWESLFDETKQKEDEVKKLWMAILDNAPEEISDRLRRESYDSFLRFFKDIATYQCSYEDLLRETERAKKAEHFNIDVQLLDDTRAALRKQETLTTNAFSLREDRLTLYICKLKGRASKGDIFKHVGTSHLAKNMLISLDKIQITDELSKYIHPDSVQTISYADWNEDAEFKSKCITIILKKYLTYRCKRLGALFDFEMDMIYFDHSKARNVERRYFKKRLVARSFYNKERTKLNFVRHRSLSIRISHLQGRFIAMLNTHQIFSTDGKTLIRGDNARNLHYKFINPNANNESDFSLIRMWYDIIQPHTRTLFSHDTVFFTDLHRAQSPITYEGGQQFDESIYEFIEGEDNGA